MRLPEPVLTAHAKEPNSYTLEHYLGRGGYEGLKKALAMAVDGVEPHLIREAMEIELEYLDEHGNVNSKVWKAAGGYAPTIGILGAVLGLIHVMENLNDPSKLGAGIAAGLALGVF